MKCFGSSSALVPNFSHAPSSRNKRFPFCLVAQGPQKPPLSDRNLLINELIRDYLAFNKYRSTLSTLMAETGQPTAPLDRSFLAEQAGVVEDRNSRQLCAAAAALYKAPGALWSRLEGVATSPVATRLFFMAVLS